MEASPELIKGLTIAFGAIGAAAVAKATHPSTSAAKGLPRRPKPRH